MCSANSLLITLAGALMGRGKQRADPRPGLWTRRQDLNPAHPRIYRVRGETTYCREIVLTIHNFAPTWAGWTGAKKFTIDVFGKAKSESKYSLPVKERGPIIGTVLLLERGKIHTGRQKLGGIVKQYCLPISGTPDKPRKRRDQLRGQLIDG
jgi:hypothetical protein